MRMLETTTRTVLGHFVAWVFYGLCLGLVAVVPVQAQEDAEAIPELSGIWDGSPPGEHGEPPLQWGST